MRKLVAVILLVFGACLTAHADIWKWVDDAGNVHYGDLSARANTVNAERVRYTPANQPTPTPSNSRTMTGQGNGADSDETPEERKASEDLQAHYCKKAKDIYRSYVGAPRLYRTSEDGEREYLSEEEMAATLADAEARVAELCVQTFPG